MKVFTSAQFTFPLPKGHRFPMSKYALLREAVEASGLVATGDLLVPEPATVMLLTLAAVALRRRRRQQPRPAQGQQGPRGGGEGLLPDLSSSR